MTLKDITCIIFDTLARAIFIGCILWLLFCVVMMLIEGPHYSYN